MSSRSIGSVLLIACHICLWSHFPPSRHHLTKPSVRAVEFGSCSFFFFHSAMRFQRKLLWTRPRLTHLATQLCPNPPRRVILPFPKTAGTPCILHIKKLNPSRALGAIVRNLQKWLSSNLSPQTQFPHLCSQICLWGQLKHIAASHTELWRLGPNPP